MATKIKELAGHHQVFCITHLPQIAARGTLHFQVSKTVDDGRTQSAVIRLSPEARVRELTRMLAGDSDRTDRGLGGTAAERTRGMKSIKALSLFSGGLDSILATRLIMAQGIAVEAVQFVTPFFNTILEDTAQPGRVRQRWHRSAGRGHQSGLSPAAPQSGPWLWQILQSLHRLQDPDAVPGQKTDAGTAPRSSFPEKFSVSGRCPSAGTP